MLKERGHGPLPYIKGLLLGCWVMIFTSRVFFSVACMDVLGRTNYIMVDTSVQHLLASLFLLLFVFLGEANAVKIFFRREKRLYI